MIKLLRNLTRLSRYQLNRIRKIKKRKSKKSIKFFHVLFDKSTKKRKSSSRYLKQSLRAEVVNACVCECDVWFGACGGALLELTLLRPEIKLCNAIHYAHWKRIKLLSWTLRRRRGRVEKLNEPLAPMIIMIVHVVSIEVHLSSCTHECFNYS